MGAVGGLFFKKASEKINNSFKDIIFNGYLYLGGIVYLGSALLNIYILKFLPYSVVLPMTSITYVWTLFISHILLNEKMNVKKVVGIILIIIGACIINI